MTTQTNTLRTNIIDTATTALLIELREFITNNDELLPNFPGIEWGDLKTITDVAVGADGPEAITVTIPGSEEITFFACGRIKISECEYTILPNKMKTYAEMGLNVKDSSGAILFEDYSMKWEELQYQWYIARKSGFLS